MNESKKKAYEKLIYQAFLDIKNSGEFNEENFYRSFHIAHVFHNLADFIVMDYDGFDENEFWRRVDVIEDQFNTSPYKKIFNENLK
ncbi:hypothetical protein AB4Z17_03865 [Paenibacillus sp. TAF43_2]|uniref:hypothetical protein n=1 Tax=Paenibacillus sp. TAF43_2 TaxID=3233069 RepID=UPI003F9CC0DE